MKSNALEIVTICGAFLVPEKEARVKNKVDFRAHLYKGS